MSRFGDGLRVIPRTAWFFAVAVYLVFATLLFEFAIPTDPEMGKWPRWGQFLFVYGLFLLLAGFILLVGYVYADAKRRGMRYVMWTLLALFIPDCIGIILYFILRDPMPKACPGCATLVKSGFTFCPNCGTPLQPTCPHCGRAVEPAWSHCPQCGTPMPLSTPRPASGGATG
ncbi:MAG: zinc ribbon domain-containing protein [Candidatus Acidiferrales bacterium]